MLKNGIPWNSRQSTRYAAMLPLLLQDQPPVSCGVLCNACYTAGNSIICRQHSVDWSSQEKALYMLLPWLPRTYYFSSMHARVAQHVWKKLTELYFYCSKHFSWPGSHNDFVSGASSEWQGLVTNQVTLTIQSPSDNEWNSMKHIKHDQTFNMRNERLALYVNINICQYP